MKGLPKTKLCNSVAVTVSVRFRFGFGVYVKQPLDKQLAANVSCIRGSIAGTGGPNPKKNYRNIGFFSNTGPDPLKNCKAIKPAFNVGLLLVHQRNAI